MNKKRIKTLIHIGLIGVCLTYIAKHFLTNTNELHILQNIGAQDLIVLVLLIIFLNALGGFKLFRILKTLDIHNLSLWKWLQIFAISRFVNFHITQGGTIYRSVALKQRYNFTYAKTLGLIFFNHWFEVILLSTISIAALAQTDLLNQLQSKVVSIQNLSLLVLLLLVLPFGLKTFLDKFSSSRIKQSWLGNRCHALVDTIHQQTSNPQLLLEFIVYTLSTTVLYTLCVWILFGAIDVQLNFVQILFFSTILLLSRSINIVPGNLGVAEIICGQVTYALGINIGSGMIISGLFRVLNYIILGILTLIFRKNW